MTALGARYAVSKSPNHIGGKAAVWFPWLSPLSLRLLCIGTRFLETGGPPRLVQEKKKTANWRLAESDDYNVE